MPSDSRVVDAAPPPKPTSTPAAPVRMRCRAAHVGRRAAHDHGHVELVDELLEVERLLVLRHVLGAHRGAADHEQVDAGVDDGLVQLLGALRRQGARHRDAGRADLGEPLADQLGLDRLGVDVLHARGRRVVRQLCDLGEQRCSGSS